MTEEKAAEAPKTYTVVVLCAESLLRIPAERGIRIAPMQSPYGDYELMFLQRSEQLPHIRTAIPRQPWIQVKGPAPSMEIALQIAVGSVNDYVRQLAFGANAWQGLIDVHLAYESSVGSTEREFFQNWVVDERGLPRVAREIDPDLMYRLLFAIQKLPSGDRSRLVRAIVQYTDALQHWRPGSEIYALSHLYMGVEAVTPLVIAREIARRGLKKRKQLEEVLNGPPPDSIALRCATYLYRKAGGYIQSRLEPWARRDVIFRGDKDTFRAAQRASNNLEHGSADHAEIHALAATAIEKTANYLRTTMLDLLQLDEADREQLVNGAYRKPQRAGGFGRQLHGVIESPDVQLAGQDQLHPHVRWELHLLDYRRNEAGATEMRLDQKIGAVLGPRARLTVKRIVFAGPTSASHTNVEFDGTRGDKPREELVTDAGAQLAVDDPRSAKWTQLIGSYTLNTNSLPNLARFWIAKLDPSLAEVAQTLTLSECVQRVLSIVDSDEKLSDRRDESRNLWEATVSADEVRLLLSASFTGERGLVVPRMLPQGQAAELTDSKPLQEMVDRTVQLIKRLATLLDELLELRTHA
ncbi:MAG: hypothetical protein H0T67_02740 [Burkholderiaceae bacterium]|nr:hypothetical protein [Burkholderiaceae bacterium]